MKNANWKNTLNRLAALVLAIMLALPYMPAFADEDPFSVVLSWQDPEGQMQSAQAQRLHYSGFENFLWVYLPAEAPLDAITLNVTDESGYLVRFDPENGSVLSGLANSGSSIHDQPVIITGYDDSGFGAAVYYLYISTDAEMADEPSFRAPSVPVRYVDENGNEIGSTSVEAALGQSTAVSAPDFDGYTLISDRTQYVAVDFMGNAMVSEVVFRYQQDVVYTAPSIPVICYDENGNVLYSWNQETSLDSATTVTAPSFDGYELNDSAEKYISVDAQGNADVAEVTFNYKAIVYTAPSIPVICYDENGNVLYSWNQETSLDSATTVTAPSFDGYELNDSAEKYISVDAQGNADVAEVTFSYKAIVYSAPAVPVTCYDENGNVLYSWNQETVLGSTTTVTAPSFDGYELNDSAEKYISVDAQGNADVAEVTFSYKAIVYTAPSIPVICYDENGNVLYSWNQETVLSSTTTVTAPSFDGYELNDSAEKYISVDAQGNADVAEVTFSYKAIVYSAPAVPVTCYDENGNVLYSWNQETALDATTTVTAPSFDGYELNDSAEKYISVDAQGNADVSEITFSYKAIVYTAPSIPVTCYDENGNVLYSWNQETALGSTTTVTAPSFDGYELNDSAEKYISVDAQGNADVAEITFSYKAIVYTAPSIHVTCYDENGNVLYSWNQETALDTTTTVTAPSFDGYELNDSAEKYISVNAQGNADVSEITFSYKAIVYTAPAVLVICYDENGNVLYSWNQETVLGSTTTVTAPSFDGYELNDSAEKYISVDAQGNADVAEVTFSYKAIVYTAPAVPVTCYDENGNVLYSWNQETALDATTTVTAPSFDGYELNDSSEKYITVDAQGNADVSEITFSYKAIVYTAPAVPVICYDENGNVLYSWNQETALDATTTVTAPSFDGYELNDSAEKYISVDAQGNADVAEITFSYKAIVYTAPSIPVTCYDENGNVLQNWTQETVLDGVTAVAAPVIEGYELNDSAEKSIIVDAQGNADVSEITFSYKAIVYTAPAVPVICYDENGNVLQRWVQELSLTDAVTVTAPEIFGYRLVSADSSYTIQPAEKGETDVSEVVFEYAKIPAPQVQVICVDNESGETVYTEQIDTELGKVITVKAPHLEGYELNGEGEAAVTVDAQGNADRSEVTFRYDAIQYAAPQVTVNCVDRADNTLLYTEKVTAALDTVNRISAPEVADYTVSGSAEDYVTVDKKGNADKTEVTFYYDAIVYTAPVVQVICVDETDDREIYRTQAQTELDKENVIYAPAVEKYVVSGSNEASVAVDKQGHADKTEVIFRYKPIANPTVQVRYVNAETGKDIRNAEVLECPVGSSIQVEAPEIDGYTRPEVTAVTVEADKDGKVNPEEVVFEYQKVPVVALVNIIYRNQDKNNEVIYSTAVPYNEGTHSIQVDYSVVDMEAYVLSDTEVKQVNVNSIGVTTPGEVVFYFREKTEVKGNVQILYCDESNYQVASAQTQECQVGNNEIKANPIDLKEGYELISEEIQYVKLDENGLLTPDKVVFYYRLRTTPEPEKTATPQPELPYDVTAMDTYGYPVGDDINFRAWPTTKENNVIRTVNRTDLAHITGVFTADDKKDWYIVELVATEEKGYLRADRVRLLSQDEINALMGYTAEPTPEATPVPSPVPDNMPIDRWAVTNDSVRFREGPSTNDEIISSLKKNTRMWVLRAETHNGERWYHVNIDGTKGYVMASFVDVMTEEESNKFQANLSTPVPTQAPDPTRMPTTEVTVSPTPTGEATPAATETAAPTATPELYRGYALTIDKTALRTGVSQTDESILEMVDEDSLVLISAQTYVNGVCWDNVEVISSGSIGFMQDSQLVHINNEQAKYYLENLMPTASPSPVPTATPAAVNGYAITLGDGVMLRAFADTNANILKVLPVDTVVMVYEQEYVNGEAWHIVNAGDYWGYIRYDQVRMMTEEEVIMYLDSFKTATPIPESSPTPAPVTDESLSSYGYVNTDKVNMRDSASTSGNRIRLLDKYAFALVLGGETDANGDVWYRVSQAGKEGYIMSDFFTVLTIGELNDFLTSDEYMNSGSNDTASGGNASADNIQSVEDYNTGVWQNPALSPSYEPFNPFATATPNPEAIVTAVPVTDKPEEESVIGKIAKPVSSDVKMYSLPSVNSAQINQNVTTDTQMEIVGEEKDPMGTRWLNVKIGNTLMYVRRDDVTVSEPAPTAEIQDIGQVTEPEENAKTSGNATGIILLSAAAVLGGGAGYAYYIYRKNERRRQAVREQQIRQQAQRNAQQPQTRAAQNNPSVQQNRAGYTAQRPGNAYMPPQGAQQKAAQQNPYRSAGAPNAAQQQNAQNRQAMQNTTAYRPENVNAPVENNQETRHFSPVQSAQTPINENKQGMQPQTPNTQQTPQQGAVRVRRSDRYKNNGGNA